MSDTDPDDRKKHKPTVIPPVTPPAPPPPVPGPGPVTPTVDIKDAPCPHVTILNASTVLADADIKPWVAALQIQVTHDFASVWGSDAQLDFVGKGGTPDPAAWVLAILDNSDQAGALGYHDLTPHGLPLGKVFAGTDKQYGYNPSVTTSHELLEMLGDPGINMTVAASDAAGGMLLYAYEACDAVEADNLGYQVNGITLSDFVYPDWFGGVTGTTFDHMGHIKAPFALAPGGYIGVWTPQAGWTQITARAEQATYSSLSPVGSRRERRRRGRARWFVSQPS